MFVILFLYNCLEIKCTYLNTFSTGNNTYLKKWLYKNQVNVFVIEFPYNCLKNKIHLMKYFFFFFCWGIKYTVITLAPNSARLLEW